MPRQKLPKAYSTKITHRKTPAVVFEKIYAWLCKQQEPGNEAIIRMQFLLTWNRNALKLQVGATDQMVNVIIQINDLTKFDGFVLSLDEFKLIWDRIL